MFDHLSLGVRDLKGAARFYDAVFAPLGHSKTWEQKNELAYGHGEQRLFWLYPVASASPDWARTSRFAPKRRRKWMRLILRRSSMARRQCAPQACILT